MDNTSSSMPNPSDPSLSSLSESERRQQLLDMLIEQQRDKERKRIASLKQAAEERTKNPIWERQKKWDEQRQRNLSKLLAETVEREQGGCSFAPKINPRSRDIASQQRRATELASPRTHTMPPPISSSPRTTSPASSRPRSRRNSNGSGNGPDRSSSPSAGSLLVGVTGYSNRFIATQTVHAAAPAVKSKPPHSSSHAPREYNPEDGFDKYATDGSSYPSIPNSRSNSPQRPQSSSPHSRSHSPSSSSYRPKAVTSSPPTSGRTSPSLTLLPPHTVDTGSLLAPPPPPPSYPPPPQAQVLSSVSSSSFGTYKPRPLDNGNSNNNGSSSPSIDDTSADAEVLVQELVRNTTAPPPPPSGPVPAEAVRLPNLPLPTVHESTEVNSTIAQTPIESSERDGARTPEVPNREPLAALHEDIQEAFDETADSKAIAAAAALRRAEARRVAALGGTVPSTANSVSHTPASRMSFTEGSGPATNEEIARLQQLLQEQQNLHQQALTQAIEEATKAAKESAEIAFAAEREEYRQRTATEMETLQDEHNQELTRLRVRYEADIADMARKPSKAQLDHYRTLSEEHLQLQAEKAKLFVSEATARRELETLRSNIDTERQQALSKESSLKVELNAANEEIEHLRGRIKALENDIIAIKARAHETLIQETNKYEKEIDNLTRAHSAEVQALRTSMRVAAAQAAKDAGFKELHSPTKGLVVKVQDLTSTDGSNVTKGGMGKGGINENNDLSYADILEALASEVTTLRIALTDTSKEARKASTEARKNDNRLTELQNEANQLRNERSAWMQQVQKENEQVQNLVKEVRTEKNRLASELTAIAEERASLDALKRAYDARESILVNALHEHGIPLPPSLPGLQNGTKGKSGNRTLDAPVNVQQLRDMVNKADSIAVPPVPVNRPPGLPGGSGSGNSNLTSGGNGSTTNSAFANPRAKR